MFSGWLAHTAPFTSTFETKQIYLVVADESSP